MESLIEKLYGDLQETKWITQGRKESEKVVEQISGMIQRERDISSEKLEDMLYELLMAAEKEGFCSGFRYGVRLLAESI